MDERTPPWEERVSWNMLNFGVGDIKGALIQFSFMKRHIRKLNEDLVGQFQMVHLETGSGGMSEGHQS